MSKRGASFLLYGEPGIGKTELAASFPDPMFICDFREDGIEDLNEAGFTKVETIWYPTTFDQFRQMLDDLGKASKSKTLVIETLAGWEAMMHEWAQKKQNADDAAWTSFNEGPRSCEKYVGEVVDKLQRIRSNGTTVIMTGHVEDKVISKPTVPKYNTFLPTVNRATWKLLQRWFQNIFFLTQDVTVAKDNAKDITEKARAYSSGERFMLTQNNPAYAAKNRYRLPSQIPMGETGEEAFTNLRNAIVEALKK